MEYGISFSVELSPRDTRRVAVISMRYDIDAQLQNDLMWKAVPLSSGN